MPSECSICLSTFKDPVCIPCGHIYCTKCLSDLVNTPNDAALMASCPTCRKTFTIVTPDLAYLPKKYHQFIIPSMRRVYLESTQLAELKAKLSRAQEKVIKLEKDQELLLCQCERHIAAADAYKERERATHQQSALMKHDFAKKLDVLRVEKAKSDCAAAEVEARRHTVELKYFDLKQRYARLQEAHSALSNVSPLPHAGPSVAREARPSITQRKTRMREASPPRLFHNQRKRPRADSPPIVNDTFYL